MSAVSIDLKVKILAMKKVGRCGRRRRSIHQNKTQQGQCTGVSQAHQPVYVKLLQWIKDNVDASQWKSSVWHRLEPAYFKDTGRGLRAKVSICPGETIISIPQQLLITVATVFNSDIGAIIFREKQQFTPQQLLTIFLVIERHRGDTSQWLPYINSLPQEYSTPLYFSAFEMELMSPCVRELAVLTRERFNKAFTKIRAFIKNCESSYEHMFSESDVRWAWSTVNTRSVYLQTDPHALLILDPEESHLALAPFLDLLNHSDCSQMSAGINVKSRTYDIITQDTYKKNEQVFICYGSHDNAKLLINYGFALPSNVSNSYMFTLGDIAAIILEYSQHLERKLSILTEAKLDKNLVCTIDGISWSLLTALKIAALSWEQLSRWKSLVQGSILSEDVEKLAHQMASQLIGSALVKSKTHLHFVDKQPSSTYSSVLRILSLDDILILERSLSCLEECKQGSETSVL
ncbi:hypothetical protein BsWGS_09259 [Bradybaena similaris]